MACNYVVEWSAYAEQDLQQALSYWAKANHSDAYPRRLLHLTSEAVKHLERNPYLMPERSIKGKSYRSYTLDRNYSIIYRLLGERVQIVMFWCNARNPY